MKKKIVLFVLTLALVLFSGCGKTPADKGKEIVISPNNGSETEVSENGKENNISESENSGNPEQEENEQQKNNSSTSKPEGAASEAKPGDEENPGETEEDSIADPMGGVPGPEGSNVNKEPEASNDEHIYPDGADYLIVETKYADFRYQDQWVEFMRTEEKETNRSVSVSFKAEINGTLYPLFDITVGDGKGSLAGTVKCDDGKERNVYVNISDLGDISGLTEGEQDRLYAMQEEVNYILNNLK